MRTCQCPCGDLHILKEDLPGEFGLTGDGFTVILDECGPKKINVIKEIRVATALPLKEAKHLSDTPPSVIVENVSATEARKVKDAIEAVGGVIRLVDNRPLDEQTVNRSMEALKEVVA